MIGFCGDIFDPTATPALTVTVTAIDCKFPVLVDAEGPGDNQILLDDCGFPYELGEVSVLGQVFAIRLDGSLERLFLTAGVKDCAGGVVSPEAFTGC